jgi:RimJ/RimL family protein N-acetyltransferase
VIILSRSTVVFVHAFPAEPRLSGYGLVLREWTEEDLATMVKLFDDPDVAHRTPLVSPFGPAAARDFLDVARRAHAEDQRIHLAITTDGGEAKGDVLLNRSLGSIGYVVGAAHRGQRLAVRALRLMTDYAHQDMAMSRVLLEIEPDNHASAAVARTAGFHLTDTTPELVEDKGRSYTLLTWAHHAP